MKVKKLAMLLTAAALLMNAVPCYAASGSASVTLRGGSLNYEQMPEQETLQTDVGFVPKTPDVLAGGFQFDSGNVVETFDMDSNGEKSNGRKGIHFVYVLKSRNTAKSVSFSAELKSNQSVSDHSTVTKYGEIDLYYNTQYANYLGWFEDDIFYSLMDINRAVTKDELIAMAEQIIDMKSDASNGQ